MMNKVILFTGLISLNIFASYDANWSQSTSIPLGENRSNVYNLDSATLEKMKMNGLIHSQKYPVSVTGLLLPYRPFVNVLSSNTKNPIRKKFYEMGKDISGFHSENDFYTWLGLSENNTNLETGIFKIPYPNGKKDNLFIGAGIVSRNGVDGLTFSCLTCHANNLFGKVVVGLTNKRPRANNLFHLAKQAVPFISDTMFMLSANASHQESQMYLRTKENLKSVEALNPQVLGLDTSLSQIALSLSHRINDEYATKSDYFEKYPRRNPLEKIVADSKPMPWWNVKYKTRWLADGSIVEGNPIYTNILWNEIGRGTDLHELESWMRDNKNKIDELTVAVFSTEAPKWSDFNGLKKIDIEKAKRGEVHFENTCSRCHGSYEKGWSRLGNDSKNYNELIKTTKVLYHEKTPVKNVGTDPLRYEGMKYFAENLNQLAISKMMQTTVVPQKGYVPPPLVGIWSRYPYLHNNSVPTLCALLTKPENRPKTFIQGPSLDINTDYDQECIGYPIGEKIPLSWKKDLEAFYDVSRSGLSNQGHFDMMLDENGNEIYSTSEKMELIEFLKTL